MSDNALERIELKIAYLENANQELSDIVYRQQRDIEQLRAQLSVYQRQLEAWRSEQQDSVNPLDERPPHY
ncbi:MAG: SlyX family protein [Gammaproteobacteria bacterium]|nr:SlyX family protein [Gammaproteobacteria bacterium]